MLGLQEDSSFSLWYLQLRVPVCQDEFLAERFILEDLETYCLSGKTTLSKDQGPTQQPYTLGMCLYRDHADRTHDPVPACD